VPKYSFQCNTCGTEFTVNVPWEEKEKVVCPQCGSGDKRQDYRSVGVITGSGCDVRNTGGICPSTGAPCGMKR